MFRDCACVSGGSFLLKMFTMYEQDTMCLMFLLCSSFRSVQVCKPATSKEGNSEVYVVCLEYKGRDFMEPWLEVLREHYGPSIPDKAMFPQESIPQDFLDQLYECATMFKNLQTDVIETNIRAYQRGRTHTEDFKIKKLKYLIANHFMEKYEVKKLPESEEVVGKSKLKKTVTLNMDPRAEEGSFADRLKKSTLQPVQLLKVLREEVESMSVTWPFHEDVQHFEFPPCVDGFKLEIGKPVKTIQSSKFCLGRLLRIRNQVRDLARKAFHLSQISQTNTQGTPSLQNGVPCKSSVGSQRLDQESELSKKVRKKYPKSELTILNYKEKLWTSIEGANEEAEIHAFLHIMEAIDGMWRDDNLLLQGYPMLTQFNVGLVYMLCHLFNEVYFMKPVKQDFAVVFIKFRQWNPVMRRFLNEVDHTIEKLHREGGSQTVLSLIPVNKLCEHCSSPSKAEVDSSEQSCSMRDGDGSAEIQEDCDRIFYKCVTELNHLCVKEQVTDIIANILEQHEDSSM
ncbi:hypothetical protein B7P43_G17491 [Cryptotermes secundus]|uniref:Mononegavirus-type SAM-dependent 2'-O-MTase domain-containing protein n=1 Tax=Cryptotermes secundus TaxID=105785 RepID=A0A2J7QFL7_9NEOP|nr:hypothetical protein B7P43_G17491 [Cryptotermes secundus]